MEQGLPYLDGKRWLDITRDERFFCAELYHELKTKEKLEAVLDQIEKALKPDAVLDRTGPWELGFEVVFYRDVVHAFGKRDRKCNREGGFSRKRTFDLCLFSPGQMIIIEAKVHQGLKSDQLTSFLSDRECASELVDLDRSKILLVGLWSSRYSKDMEGSRDPRVHEFHAKVKVGFDAILHWNDLGFEGPRFDEGRNLFKAADDLYGK